MFPAHNVQRTANILRLELDIVYFQLSNAVALSFAAAMFVLARRRRSMALRVDGCMNNLRHFVDNKAFLAWKMFQEGNGLVT